MKKISNECGISTIISSLETQLNRIDTQLDILRNETIDAKFSSLEHSINTNRSEQIVNSLNLIRQIYLKYLNSSLESILNDLNKCKLNTDELMISNRFIQFLPNRRQTSFTTDLLIKLIFNSIERDRLFNTKLKYFHLFHTFHFRQLDLANSPTQTFFKCKKLCLSNKLLFEFVEFQKRMCYMQIKSIHTNLELFRSRTIHLKQFEQYDFISFGTKICGLFHDDDSFILKLFDNKLNLIKLKSLSYRVTLHSMTANDIICYSNNKLARYILFDHNLRRKISFGQKEDSTLPYYLADSSLIHVTPLYVYTSFYDIKTEQIYLRIISRPFGLLHKSVRLGTKNSVKSSLIRLDSLSNSILIKFANSNLIKVLDLDGNVLFETRHDLFDSFKSLELSEDNELFYLEKNRKLFVL